MHRPNPYTLAVALASWSLACSSAPGITPTEDAQPGSETSSLDATDEAAGFPATHPTVPTVVTSGGPVLSAANIVPVFFPNDSLEPQIEQFLQALPSSSYWTAISNEYGVGKPTVATSIVSTTAAPTSTTDNDIRAWLASQADGTHAGWPQAEASMVFVVFYPATTSIVADGKASCTAFDGYHLDGVASDGSTPLVYAVSTRCVSGDAAVLDEVTVATSHEILEASTDPLYLTNPAFDEEDPDHIIWTLATAGELADMCTLEPEANQRLVGSFLVQRSWSNISAFAGHDPCVPALAQPYFNAEANLANAVQLVTSQGAVTTKGISVPVGQSATVDVMLYSDAPTAAWHVEALDTTALLGGEQELQFTWDSQTGANGDVLHLTITAVRAGPFGGSALMLRSVLGATTHVSLGFVSN